MQNVEEHHGDEQRRSGPSRAARAAAPMEERAHIVTRLKRDARHADIGHDTRNGTPRAPTPSLVTQPTAADYRVMGGSPDGTCKTMSHLVELGKSFQE
jgi:hypothetical protein